MLAALDGIWNVALILIGFGLVILVHELGHFLAARWAGIRVHAFAIGFGPAVVSWRRGMGLRRGSSEPAYLERLRREGVADAPGVSQTEYRLNWLPLGGYVRMLGQEDGHPDRTSGAPDSYTAKPVWKRMVVVCAGVVMNVLLAAALFVVVFMVGKPTPAPVIGAVAAGGPAERAGVERGDVVLAVNGADAEAFEDVIFAAALSGRGDTVELRVRKRDGSVVPVEVEPEHDERLNMRFIGVWNASAARVVEPADRGSRLRFEGLRESLGLAAVEPGMTVAEVNGEALAPTALPSGDSARLAPAVLDAVVGARGARVPMVFVDAEGVEARAEVRAAPEMQTAPGVVSGEPAVFDHLLGLTPATRVLTVTERGAAQGLRAGDLIVRVGSVSWPSVLEVVGEVREHRNRTVEVVVLRGDARVVLEASVSGGGTIGFGPVAAFDAPWLARTPALRAGDEGEEPEPLAAQRMSDGVVPGMRLAAAGGMPVSDFGGLRAALRAATLAAHRQGEAATVEVVVELPDAASGSPGVEQTITLALTSGELAELHGLGWSADRFAAMLAPGEFTLRADGPVDALVMGVRETKRTLVRTYLTFRRLAEGTVRVDQLKGPVGITHLGSIAADRGFIVLLFFLGLISANLAVINFLPVPVVDGGLFLMLVYEAIARRPVPIVVQNAATLAGLALIAAVFVIVTIGDIRNLLP